MIAVSKRTFSVSSSCKLDLIPAWLDWSVCSRSLISCFRDRITTASFSTSICASRRRDSSLRKVASCSSIFALDSLRTSNCLLTVSNSSCALVSSVWCISELSSAARITSSRLARSFTTCSRAFSAALFLSSRIARFWLSFCSLSRKSRNSFNKVFTRLRCFSISVRSIVASDCCFSKLFRLDCRSSSAESSCCWIWLTSFKALNQWYPYHSRKFCCSKSWTVLYSPTLAACFSRLRTLGLISAMISSARSRLCWVVSNRRIASSLRL